MAGQIYKRIFNILKDEIDLRKRLRYVLIVTTKTICMQNLRIKRWYGGFIRYQTNYLRFCFTVLSLYNQRKVENLLNMFKKSKQLAF